MILRYATNLKLAKELYQASKPKLQEDKGMIELFEHTFGLQKELVKYVGIAEATTASASFINKNISRLASLSTIGILSVAAYKHFEAGQGKKGAQHALNLLGLATLSLLDTFSCNKK
ncbi:TPA: hypothetical protein ACOHTZ_000871 [Staphylococcus aureus]